MANKNKKDNKPFVKTRKRMDNSIEVELQKSPAKTLPGKILLYMVVIGMGLAPIVGLIYLLIEFINQR